jgi:HEAT repeat protein
LKNASDSADFHREMAKKCRANQMIALATAHLERVVELDPTDSASWATLGYTLDKSKGLWVRKSELSFRQGTVVKDGKTIPTLAKVLQDKKDELSRYRAETEKKLKIELQKYRKKGKDFASALEYLENFADPVAVEFVQEQLLDELKRGGGNSDLFMNMLLRMPGGATVSTFIALASNLDLTDGPGSLVERSLEALGRYEPTKDAAIAAFAQLLVTNPKEIYKSEAEFVRVTQRVDRAARNLQTLGSEVAIFPLINALLTTGNVVVNRPQTNAIDRSGGIQQSTGGASYVPRSNEQESVLAALIELTGENFRYDQLQWRHWYKNKYAFSNLDLRRIE